MENNDSKKLTFGVFKQGLVTLVEKIDQLIKSAVKALKDAIVGEDGNILADIIPIGAGLKKNADGKIVFDADNVTIDASKVNIDTATTEAKGLMQVGTGLSVNEGLVSVATKTSLPAEGEDAYDITAPAGIGYVTAAIEAATQTATIEEVNAAIDEALAALNE